MTHNAHFLAHTLFFYRFAGKNFKQLTPTTTPIIWRADDIWNCLSENSSTRLYSISYNWLSISIKSTVSFPLRIVLYVHKEREREREGGRETEGERESGGSFELTVQTGMLYSYFFLVRNRGTNFLGVTAIQITAILFFAPWALSNTPAL